MEKIFYFELDEEAIIRHSEEEILEAYFEKLSLDAMSFIPVVSAYITEIDYPLEECSTGLLLLKNTRRDTYWIEEEKYLKYLEDADIIYELYNDVFYCYFFELKILVVYSLKNSMKKYVSFRKK